MSEPFSSLPFVLITIFRMQESWELLPQHRAALVTACVPSIPSLPSHVMTSFRIHNRVRMGPTLITEELMSELCLSRTWESQNLPLITWCGHALVF